MSNPNFRQCTHHLYFFSPFFTKINCIYRLNMILLHFPKAQIMSSHAIRNNLWLIYFFQARRRHWPWGPLESPMGELLWQIKKPTQALETWAGLLLRLFLGLKNITTLKHGLSIVRTFNRVINHVPPLLPLGRPQLLIQCCSILSDAPFYIILLKNNGQKKSAAIVTEK